MSALLSLGFAVVIAVLLFVEDVQVRRARRKRRAASYVGRR
ncbi:MAG TPA: hypothetical protein VET26_12400 [Candidatus Sulfotelmatobacter sp.]|nr:hypothetical protein [Candidatus Sulfotelmatobacter sp.]